MSAKVRPYSDAELELRLALARRLPQPKATRDPLARAIAKAAFVLCGLLLAGALLWLRDNIAWTFIGR